MLINEICDDLIIKIIARVKTGSSKKYVIHKFSPIGDDLLWNKLREIKWKMILYYNKYYYTPEFFSNKAKAIITKSIFP